MTDEIDYSTADLVCCEFDGTEGDGSVAVGYKPWVILPEKEDDFQKVIDNTIPITIKWPKNLEVKPPPKMARAVAKLGKNLKWELWPGTKIYGVGSKLYKILQIIIFKNRSIAMGRGMWFSSISFNVYSTTFCSQICY